MTAFSYRAVTRSGKAQSGLIEAENAQDARRRLRARGLLPTRLSQSNRTGGRGRAAALGVRQRGKWDITWLPGMTGVRDPISVGDRIRADVYDRMSPAQPLNRSQAPETPKTGFWAFLARLWASLTGGK